MNFDIANLIYVYVAPGLLGMATFAAVVYLFTVSLFSLYLAYCTIWRARESGQLATVPAVPRGICYAILVAAVALDVVFNILIGSVAFLELPEIKRLTFTARCKKHLHANTWRGRFARWVCHGWLNPFDPGHC